MFVCTGGGSANATLGQDNTPHSSNSHINRSMDIPRTHYSPNMPTNSSIQHPLSLAQHPNNPNNPSHTHPGLNDIDIKLNQHAQGLLPHPNNSSNINQNGMNGVVLGHPGGLINTGPNTHLPHTNHTGLGDMRSSHAKMMSPSALIMSDRGPTGRGARKRRAVEPSKSGEIDHTSSSNTISGPASHSSHSSRQLFTHPSENNNNNNDPAHTHNNAYNNQLMYNNHNNFFPQQTGGFQGHYNQPPPLSHPSHSHTHSLPGQYNSSNPSVFSPATPMSSSSSSNSDPSNPGHHHQNESQLKQAFRSPSLNPMSLSMPLSPAFTQQGYRNRERLRGRNHHPSHNHQGNNGIGFSPAQLSSHGGKGLHTGSESGRRAVDDSPSLLSSRQLFGQYHDYYHNDPNNPGQHTHYYSRHAGSENSDEEGSDNASGDALDGSRKRKRGTGKSNGLLNPNYKHSGGPHDYSHHPLSGLPDDPNHPSLLSTNPYFKHASARSQSLLKHSQTAGAGSDFVVDRAAKLEAIIDSAEHPFNTPGNGNNGAKTTKTKGKKTKEGKKGKKVNKVTLERQRIQKGLRHFSLKVCEKVEEQRVTSYNKVADELVHELSKQDKPVTGMCPVDLILLFYVIPF